MKTLGKFKEGLQMLKKIHSGRRQELGDDDPDTLDTAFEIGDMHLLEKRYGEAVKILQDVYKARKRVLGKDDVETLDW